jgi:hypothetical protein
MRKIVKKKGLIPDSRNQDIGSCYYKWIKFFAKCVKDAPDAPEGMSWKRNYLKTQQVAQELQKARQEAAKNSEAFVFFDDDSEALDSDD